MLSYVSVTKVLTVLLRALNYNNALAQTELRVG